MATEYSKQKMVTNGLKILIVMCIFVFFMSIAKNIINEFWARNRSVAGCVPEIEGHDSGVYLQSAAHYIDNDLKIKNFVVEYIDATRNERISSYSVKGGIKGNDRYDKARLSDAKYKAMFMSVDDEFKINSLNYIDSTKRFQDLFFKKMEILFLIDEIIVMPVAYLKPIPVIVRGQYEGIFDNMEKDNQNLPPRFLGYKEIRLEIVPSFPQNSLGEDKKWENPLGLYVRWSEERTLDAGEKAKLMERSDELFLQRNDQ